jgi:hypothetical protein
MSKLEVQVLSGVYVDGTLHERDSRIWLPKSLAMELVATNKVVLVPAAEPEVEVEAAVEAEPEVEVEAAVEDEPEVEVEAAVEDEPMSLRAPRGKRADDLAR